MQRSEAQFCRDQAQRILELAKGCADSKVRDHLAMMANEWLDRAKVKETPPPNRQSFPKPKSKLRFWYKSKLRFW
jgi:hypothetical protein